MMRRGLRHCWKLRAGLESGEKPKDRFVFGGDRRRKGLLGSRYFAEHPTVERKNIVADLNMDMYLPLFPLK